MGSNPAFPTLILYSSGFEADPERHWSERGAAGFGGAPTNVGAGEKKSRLPDFFIRHFFIHPMVRAHIHFCGTVQGVGFRYTCLSFAQQLSLTGWVKNLSDGGVEAVVEGPREKIEELLSRLEGQFGGFIRDRHIEWWQAREEFDKFSII